MSTDHETPRPQPMIRLLEATFDAFGEEIERRLADTPYSDIRISHGCVFGNIDPEGTRLTELAERARMTKQSVGEVTSDLEQRGYVERVPDPSDGRAKIIRLTERGHAAQALGIGLIEEIEREWAEGFGAERVAALREALEEITAEAARGACRRDRGQARGRRSGHRAGLVRRQRARRPVDAQRDARRVPVRRRGRGPLRRPRGRPVLDPAGQANVALPPRGRPGGLPDPARAVHGARRRGGAVGRSVGLLPLPAEDGAHDRQHRRGAGADPRGGGAEGEGQRALSVRASRRGPRRGRPRRVDVGVRDVREFGAPVPGPAPDIF